MQSECKFSWWIFKVISRVPSRGDNLFTLEGQQEKQRLRVPDVK
jgi:hypothetical protein